MLSNPMTQTACVVIPARYASSRFPGKPLADILGKPMIIWVAELASLAVGQQHVYIATDSDVIRNVCESAGFSVLMTGVHCLTGTDRICEAAQFLDYDIIVNVQGDEPVLNPQDIINCIEIKSRHIDSVVNGFTLIGPTEDPSNTNIPKVIFNENNHLVYMSRQPLPGFKSEINAPTNYYKQVCVYGFTHNDLALFSSFGRKSRLEHSEDIEILRFLEFSAPIVMFECMSGSLAVDVPSDVLLVENHLNSLGND